MPTFHAAEHYQLYHSFCSVGSVIARLYKNIIKIDNEIELILPSIIRDQIETDHLLSAGIATAVPISSMSLAARSDLPTAWRND